MKITLYILKRRYLKILYVKIFYVKMFAESYVSRQFESKMVSPHNGVALDAGSPGFQSDQTPMSFRVLDSNIMMRSASLQRRFAMTSMVERIRRPPPSSP